MIIFRLLSFIVVISALMNVLVAMSDRGQPKTFKTERGKCLTFNRVSPTTTTTGGVGPRRSSSSSSIMMTTRRLRLEDCAVNNDDPDQWIYIRKINKNEGVFYNYAANQIIAYNSLKNKFQIVDRVDLYRGREISPSSTDTPVYYLRLKLDHLWKKYEKCKKKVGLCGPKRRGNLLQKIKLFLSHKDADKLLTREEAKWVVQRPRLKIRHKRRKDTRIDALYFNLQDKLYRNGYYKILVSLNETSTASLKEKFM